MSMDQTGRMGGPGGSSLPFTSRRRRGKKRYYKRVFNPGRPIKNFRQFKLPFIRFVGNSVYAQPFYVCNRSLTTMTNMVFSGQITASLDTQTPGMPVKTDFFYAIVRMPQERTLVLSQGLRGVGEQLLSQFAMPTTTDILKASPPPSLADIAKYPNLFNPLQDVVCYGEGSVSLSAGGAITRHQVRHGFQVQQFMEQDSLWFLLKTDDELKYVDGVFTARFVLRSN